MTKVQRYSGIMFIFTGLFNIADYFLTIKLLQIGIEEWNPLVRHLLNTKALPFIKIILIPLTLLLIWKSRAHYQSRLLLYSITLFTVYFLLMCYFIYIFQTIT